MVGIEFSLRHLKDSVGRFVAPSAAQHDVRALEVQIELRQQALRDIEIIRCRLRPFVRRESETYSRLRSRRATRSCLAGSFRWRVPVDS